MTGFSKRLLVLLVMTAGTIGASGQAVAAQSCADADTSISDLAQEQAEAAVLCLANVERANAAWRS